MTMAPSGSYGLYGSRTSGSVARAAIAELVGTFILVFAGTAVAVAAILGRITAGGGYDSLAIALAFGLALAALVGALGHVSGAHFNPAVTIALTATGKFPSKWAGPYVVAQLVGALLGAAATWVSYGGPARTAANLAATTPQSGVTDLRALVVEILVTFILVFVIMAVATDDRVPSAAIAPIAVGFALAIGVFVAGPVSGGAVNPARALGPMLLAGTFEGVWVYVIGPIVGALAAAFLYDRLLSDAEPPDAPEESDDGPATGRDARFSDGTGAVRRTRA